MIPLCPYRAACLAKWNVTRPDFRCSFEKYNLMENCPRYVQQNTDDAAVGQSHRGGVQQPDRDRRASQAGATALQLSLGGGW